MKRIKSEEKINLYNLFKHGNCVPWPGDNEPGFLSYKRCPNLWSLGARPYMDDKDSVALIEDIITCANIAASAPFQISVSKNNTDNIYINAYKELTSYFKHLFIYYNNKINDVDLNSIISNWGWALFFQDIYTDANYDKVVIVSYNYDIWLERILSLSHIPFNISEFELNNNEKFQIIKPHGSISFTHKKKLDRISFRIPYDRELLEISDGEANDFQISYNNLDENYLISAIIPPAGDSSRYNLGWANALRKLAKEKAAELTENDELFICGISYWHVDRAEIDEVLASLNSNVNIKLINPNPPRALNAVLSSLFDKYLCYTNSDILGE